ncbi:hypothetical protein Pmar_PMAR027533 [Perkinsus marinus ATCC 50983]|uniref:Uncharacterized protein n=1 Tax=Perkinsus marinus (strain ATCC 50983 / TXsc) TaxID=423536 RepID=C5LPE2_PERM5|nr:hypothetical protein Pmar_PMAR027533 [Perkinsus marinus ATCC 50983]EER01404.1 hypothetical protein Pmar_PMAR027533 [Perkinsus marinus ATCC 50983]|eukprot:XP_002768686.1 hypothetical protein Pmar_PMAR027533 [Perkinsus marinus ATCC 50983]
MKVSDEAFMFLGQGRPYEDGRRGVLTPSRWAAVASHGWSTADDATLKEWKQVVRALVGRVLNDTPLLRRSMGKNPRDIAKPWVDKAISKHWDAIMPTFVNVEKVGSAMSKLEYDERMAQIEREIEHVAHHYRMHVAR